MTSHLASCTCGRLTVAAEGEPLRVSVCHCLACQRRSGSAFAVQARYPADAVAVRGERKEYVQVGDEGGRARFRFCPQCGATVLYTLDSVPAQVAIPVGAFADPGFPPPGTSIYASRQHGWVHLSDSIEQFE